jgi:O-acetyl-ADP-ribose deacetylase (regulator of RNase III)
MKKINGNLIDLAINGKFNVIFHGANCHHTMGSGIAREIRERLPFAYEADLKTIKSDPAKLGTISIGHGHDISNKNLLYVVNCYTQFNYGRDTNTRYVEYGAIRSCMKEIKKTFNDCNFKIGFPKIGASLANGDWNIIERIIDEELKDMDITLVIFE